MTRAQESFRARLPRREQLQGLGTASTDGQRTISSAVTTTGSAVVPTRAECGIPTEARSASHAATTTTT